MRYTKLIRPHKRDEIRKVRQYFIDAGLSSNKPQLNKNQIYYLFNSDEEKERSKKTRDAAVFEREIQPDDAKKGIEQTTKPPEEPPKDPPPQEDPKDTQIQFLTDQLQEEKTRREQLEDALHKTEQFKPATQLESKQRLAIVLDDDTVVTYLKSRAKQSGDIIDFGRVGSGALVQALTQYKHSFGVVELFGRVIEK